MPFYEWECKNCQYYEEGTWPITTPKKRTCPTCGQFELRKLISKVNFIIKGGSAKNSYYIPPSNKDLGLPSEYESRKMMEDEFYIESLHKGGPLTSQEREEVKEGKRLEKEATKDHDNRIDSLKDKYKGFTEKVGKAFKKAKDRPRWYRENSKAKRKERGELGLKKAKDAKILADVEKK